jgi:hypothetical protein
MLVALIIAPVLDPVFPINVTVVFPVTVMLAKVYEPAANITVPPPAIVATAL